MVHSSVGMQTNDHSNESAMPVGSFVFHYFKVEVHFFVDAPHRYGKLRNPFVFLSILASWPGTSDQHMSVETCKQRVASLSADDQALLLTCTLRDLLFPCLNWPCFEIQHRSSNSRYVFVLLAFSLSLSISLSPDRNHHEMFIEASGRRDLHNNPECAGHQATLAFSLEFETLRARTALTDTSALRNQKLHHILFTHHARLH